MNSPAKPGDGGEAEIRQLFRDAVGGLEPSAQALEQLREAVPMRRRRRRRMWLGAAASVALFGVGAPVVMSAAEHVGGGGGEATLDAGTDRTAGGEPAGGGDAGEDGSHPAGGDTEAPGRPGDGAETDGQPPATGDEEGSATTRDGSEMSLSSPTCARTQLGEARTTTESPDAEGRVYGTIRLVNVSSSPCRVAGNGELAALPMGMASADSIQIVDRTEGDRAERLPTPDETLEELVLPPGEAYEVQFAWVPSVTAIDSCDVATEPAGSGGPSPNLERGEPATDEPTATGGPGPDDVSGEDGGGGATGETGTGGESTGGTGGAGGTGETGGESPGSGASGETGGTGTSGGDTSGGTVGGDGVDGTTDGVVLRYTPAAGQPEAAQIRLEGSCSGTIYRTGVLQAPTE
ncbi:hypothetical protein [Streptomyces mayteni]